MRVEDKPQFAILLADVLAGYGKALPEKAEVNIWFNQLAPFSPATIKRAFETYRMERPDFAPAPNGIAARCKLLDGRPDENEAWAVAMTSQDERETIVWTDEMAEAFNVARPLLASGDEIGARMAFKDAYTRLVQAARAGNRPAKWSVSAGWDAERRELVVSRSVAAGLLAGPQPHLAIGYEGNEPPARPEGLKRVLEALGQLENPLDKAERIRAERQAAEDVEDRARRVEVDRKVKAYLNEHPEARFGELLKTRERA